MKYTEETFASWTSPLSKTEEQRVENAVLMTKDAVTSYYKLTDCTMEIFAQGSYANNTNVRQNSDVDICVMLTSTFYCNYVDGKTDKDYGYTEGSITYPDYKTYIGEALKKKFGDYVINVGNKSINIEANSYHINADIVPAFQYRDYKILSSTDSGKYVEGIQFFSNDGTEVINYPKDHISNGKQKNNSTNYEYKKLVRIMKHIRNDMVGDGKADGDKITSFLIECLVWNVPNGTIMAGKTWVETVQNVIVFLWNAIKDEKHKQWGEVSERLYLFHSGRKWTPEDTKLFLYNMYNYIDFK
jgi:hypothetical protein